MRLVILFFIVMAAQGLVDEEELRLVCSAQEATIGRFLKGWEKGLLFLQKLFAYFDHLPDLKDYLEE